MFSPAFVLLSEPMLFQCDLESENLMFRGEYCSTLSSEDVYDIDLPFTSSRAKGGTMMMWRKDLHKFVTVLPSPSSCMLPILFSPPSLQPCIQMAIYLPTSGRDVDFAIELSNLSNLLIELRDKYPGLPVYIRGDANVNPKNKNRVDLMKNLCMEFNLIFTNIDHPTYHHFTGNGNSDSQLDILLHSHGAEDKLTKIICKLSDPTILSHHDLILSSFTLHRIQNKPSQHISSVPRLTNNRVKIQWSEEGINAYLSTVNDNLSALRERWINVDTESTFSVLLSSTYAFLDKCARSTNSYTDLAFTIRKRSLRKPLYLVKSERYLRTCLNTLKKTPINSNKYYFLSMKLKSLRQQHKRLIRHCRMSEAVHRDEIIDSFHADSSNSRVFTALKKLNQSNTDDIQYIRVGSQTYSNDSVPDGIYESIKNLKTEDVPSSLTNVGYLDLTEEYQLILEICSSRKQIPLLTYSDAEKNLKSLKKNVNDFYNITPLHFLHAGPAGIEHFCQLMNAIIRNINFAGIPELNSIYSIVLYKGHGKDKNDAKSYRTISTCPLIAKALDAHVRSLSIEAWNTNQASTQYQGDNMSHELASLLLTETIQYSLFSSKRPLYVLFLDARAAFDRTIGMILIRDLFFTGTDDQRLLYINNRLHKRQTFCEFNRQLMGPILDTRGLEQGGIYSSDAYKIYNTEQTTTSQQSLLGASVYNDCISCISLADDTALISDSLVNLNNLLHLTSNYCSKYDVELVPEKTNLIKFQPIGREEDLDMEVLQLKMYGKTIPF